MQLAQVYRSNAIARAQEAMRRMDPLLTTQQDISHYVENLLTRAQEKACDMATD